MKNSKARSREKRGINKNNTPSSDSQKRNNVVTAKDFEMHDLGPNKGCSVIPVNHDCAEEKNFLKPGGGLF